jgi:biotin carboxyl carrier protein
VSELESAIGGQPVAPADGWQLDWSDRALGIGRVSNGEQAEVVLVEGSGTEWVVTLRGRRIPVVVRSWRERVLAEAEIASGGRGGSAEVRATLPGMVLAVAVKDGDEVRQGDPLVTVEAMKMQNEVRAPRSGRVGAVEVEPGQPVAAGALILRID